MPRIRDRYFESPVLHSIEREGVSIELKAAGSATGSGPDRGMLTIEIAQRGVCGWVVIYHSYTRYPVERLATDGRRVLRYLMDSLHGPIVAGDTARLAVLAPRLRLIAPGQILASGGVSRDEEVLAAEAERRARQVGTSKSSPACVMAKAA